MRTPMKKQTLRALSVLALSALLLNAGCCDKKDVAVTQTPLGPDLMVKSLTFTPHQVAPGASVTVSTLAINQGDEDAPAVKLTLYLSDNLKVEPSDTVLGSRTVPALKARSAEALAVDTVVGIPQTVTGRVFYILAIIDSDDIVNEESEENNLEAFGSLSVEQQVDLTVESISHSAAAAINQQVDVSRTFRNSGSNPSSPFVVEYYLSTDQIIDGADHLVGSETIPGLAGGAVASGSYAITTPRAGGIFYLILKVDSGDAVAEGDETNNVVVAPQQLTVTGPNLAVSAADYNPHQPIPADTLFTINRLIINDGTAAAGPFQVAYYLSADQTLDGGDTLLGTESRPGLNAGADDDLVINMNSGATAGTFYIIIRLDATDQVVELNETDNDYAYSNTIQIMAQPDLTADAITLSQTTITTGQAITVTRNIRNSGGGTTGSFWVAYYLSRDQTLDLTGDALMFQESIGGLSAGEANSTPVQIAPGAPMSGTYYLIVEVDGDFVTKRGSVTESDETNNVVVSTQQLTIKGPDLRVIAASAPTSVEVNTSFDISRAIINEGDLVSGVCEVAYYLSTDQGIDGGDTLLGTEILDALSPAATNSQIVSFNSGGATGTFYVLVRVDSASAVSELEETDNDYAIAQTINIVAARPNLTADTLSLSQTTATPTQQVDINRTVKNLGGGAAGAFSVAYYLSADQTLDAGDTWVATEGYIGLPGGGQTSGAYQLSTPAKKGAWYVILSVDSGSAVTESNETDNVVVVPQQLTIQGADLRVTTASAPASVAVNTSFDINRTIINEGDIPSGPFEVAYYLSADTAIDGGDYLLGTESLQGLDPTATDTRNASFNSGTATGTFYVLIRVDSASAVNELEEWDNDYAITSQTIDITAAKPDLVAALVSAPTLLERGAREFVTVRITNSGAAAIPAGTSFEATLYVGTASASPDQEIATITVSSGLSVGEVWNHTYRFTMPALGSGTHLYFWADAGAIDAIDESDETNNAASQAVTLGTYSVPDLQPLSVWSNMAGSTVNNTLSIRRTIRCLNAACRPYRINYYLSADTAIDAGDYLAGVEIVAGQEMDTEIPRNLAISTGPTAGNFYVLIRVDPDDAVLESNESNQDAADGMPTTIVAGSPDLTGTIDSLNLSGNRVAVNENFTISRTLTNQQPFAAGPFTVKYYFSADSNLDGTDTLVGTEQLTTLAASGTDNNTAVSLNSGSATGAFKLFMQVDSEGAIDETSENNNAILYFADDVTVLATGQPDLVPTFVTTPATLQGGVVQDLQVKITNEGTGSLAAGTPFLNRLYIGEIGPTQDFLIDEMSQDVSIPVMGAHTFTFNFPLPLSISGGWLVFVTDTGSAVTESNETNNEANTTLTLNGPPATPDLMAISVDPAITSTTMFSPVTANRTIWSLTNTAAGAFSVQYYLSTDKTIDGGDFLAGTESFASGMAADTQDAGTYTIIAPATTGAFWLIMRVDSGSAVTEHNETNNDVVSNQQLNVQ